MRVYLAGSFGRAEELNRYRAQLEAHGIVVTSRWLLGAHEWTTEAESQMRIEQARQFAEEDIADILDAEILVAFTEHPGGSSRGGRHVEYGMALALGKTTLVCGPVENVFCSLTDHQHDTWPETLDALLQLREQEEIPSPPTPGIAARYVAGRHD